MNNPASPTSGRIVLGVLAAMLVTPLFALNYREQVQLDELEANAVVVTAQLNGKECQNHGKVHYRYVAENRTLRGQGSCPLNCNAASIGDPIQVTYSHAKPSHSECEDFLKLQANINGAYFCLLFISIVLAVAILRVTSNDNLQVRDGR
ncbi:hypothetical protein GM658_20060 [Pseudoduganella eburnea]|uniref:DUF3592 domain-containing protein n=1 Tax=Massilia eburnea TaxID=1776165 RepID=A0A6L6QL94_9BURK|nr:DUF3592 domain-containing protein [Massilia eburnea]MTW12905.1 hypothetical protein [Massilia eburnea]